MGKNDTFQSDLQSAIEMNKVDSLRQSQVITGGINTNDAAGDGISNVGSVYDDGIDMGMENNDKDNDLVVIGTPTGNNSSNIPGGYY